MDERVVRELTTMLGHVVRAIHEQTVATNKLVEALERLAPKPVAEPGPEEPAPPAQNYTPPEAGVVGE